MSCPHLPNKGSYAAILQIGLTQRHEYCRFVIENHLPDSTHFRFADAFMHWFQRGDDDVVQFSIFVLDFGGDEQRRYADGNGREVTRRRWLLERIGMRTNADGSR